MVISRLQNIIRKRFLRYQPLVEIFVIKNNIVHNYKTFLGSVGDNAVAPVLKSNGYGHGLVEVAKILAPYKPPFFVVDSIFEALRLRHNGIDTPILVIGYTSPENILATKLKRIDFTITARETLQILVAKASKPLRLHLKFDTGMHRQGLDPQSLTEDAALVKKNHNLQIVGICSHQGDADKPTGQVTTDQIALWNKLVDQCKTLFPQVEYWHLAATSGSALHEQIKSNLVRIGIGLFGYSGSPLHTNLPLLPTLQINSVITSLRTLAPHQKVGYNAAFETTRVSKLATIPMGYFEGLDRRLSNVGMVLVNHKPARFAGTISMNISSIDVTDAEKFAVGDKVVVASADPKNPNTVNKLAKQANMIPYEFLVHIPGHLRRTVI